MNIDEGIMNRVIDKPIITPSSVKNGYMLMTPGQTTLDGKYILLIPIQKFDKISPAVFVAVSENGEEFHIDDKPVIVHSEKYAEIDKFVSRPNISYIPEDEMYYITRPLDNSLWGKAELLSKTKDFKNIEEVGIITLPHNSASCIFQGKIGNKYARIDRPDTDPFKPSLWISFSDDLKYWGEYSPLLQPYTNWNADEILPTPPIRTDDGWLVIYTGVKEGRRSVGALLLDLEDPTKIIAKGKSPILTPNLDFEYLGTGIKPSVDTCGAIVNEDKDEITIYYCGGGMSIGVAKASLKELIKKIKYEDKEFGDWIWS